MKEYTRPMSFRLTKEDERKLYVLMKYVDCKGNRSLAVRMAISALYDSIQAEGKE